MTRFDVEPRVHSDAATVLVASVVASFTCLTVGGCGGGGHPEQPSPDAGAEGLGRGINFGNMFDAPHEGDWGTRYSTDYVPLVKSIGFTHVRLPVRWTNHAALTEDATLDESFAAQIDRVIDLVLGAGLFAVVDAHHYWQLDGDPLDFGEAAVEESVIEQRLVNIWRQLGQRYRAKSDRLLFELYNEPHGRLSADAWNLLASRLLAAVRESNPDRTVLVGGADGNNVGGLAALVLPNDPNLIISIHNYDPFTFTFQGSYIPGSNQWLGTLCCGSDQQQLISRALDVAATYGARTGREVYLGEFGSSVAADQASRIAYTRYVRDEAEARAMPWAVWSLIDKGIYDPVTGAWREDLKTALLGPKTSAGFPCGANSCADGEYCLTPLVQAVVGECRSLVGCSGADPCGCLCPGGGGECQIDGRRVTCSPPGP